MDADSTSTVEGGCEGQDVTILLLTPGVLWCHMVPFVDIPFGVYHVWCVNFMV